jgi:type III pantothenate kinase
MYGGPGIAIDFGTATTFDAIDASGAYLGGAIAPGIETSVEALASRTAQLRRVEFVKPPYAIATSTVENLQSGIIYGFAGQVDGIVGRFRAELGGDARVVATGGLANVIASESASIEIVDKMLTLHGLRIAYERRQAAG